MTEAARILLFVVALAAGAAQAQSPPADHLGVASCASGVCHGVAKPVESSPVLRNEYVTWSHFDPHAGAFRTLRSEASRRMGTRLGIESPEREPACLACHAENVPVERRGPRFQFDDGVGCESCHGASSGWIASHDDAPRVTHADNLARGLRALEQAEVRAPVCSACHVGGAGRFASHSLMAAGHPRLAFELDTYSALWRTAGGREHYRRDADYRERKAEDGSLRFWLAGLLESAERTLEITADASRGQGVFPDFALFNCYSCHRSMRLRRWSDAGLAPGSLRASDSALVMLAAALDALDPANAQRLRERTTALHRAVNEGLPAMRQAAAELRTSLAALRAVLLPRRIEAQDRTALLEALLAAAERGEYPDYSAAEQAAMAIVMLLADTGRTPDSDPRIAALFADLESDERYDPARFARLLSRIP